MGKQMFVIYKSASVLHENGFNKYERLFLLFKEASENFISVAVLLRVTHIKLASKKINFCV